MDYTETCSLDVKATILRIVFTLTLFFGSELRQVDISNGFDLGENVP